MVARTKRTIAAQKKKFLAALRLGYSISAACEAAKLPRRSVYEWREKDEAFEAQWDDALESGTDRLEDVALARATEGWEEPVFYQGDEVATVTRFSNRLLQFLLIARRREKYGPRGLDIEATGKGRVTVKISSSDAEL